MMLLRPAGEGQAFSLIATLLQVGVTGQILPKCSLKKLPRQASTRSLRVYRRASETGLPSWMAYGTHPTMVDAATPAFQNARPMKTFNIASSVAFVRPKRTPV